MYLRTSLVLSIVSALWAAGRVARAEEGGPTTGVSVVKASGPLEIRPESSAAWQPFSPGQPIRNGDLLKALEAGTQVKVAEGCLLWLNAGTVVQFRGDSVALFAGEILVDLQSPARTLVVRTPGATTTIQGGRVSVKWVEKATQVTVVDGEATLGAANGTCLLRAGQQSTVAANQPPSAPEAVDARSVIAWAGLKSGQPEAAKPEEAAVKPEEEAAKPDQPTAAEEPPTEEPAPETPEADQPPASPAPPPTPPAAPEAQPVEPGPASAVPGVTFIVKPDVQDGAFPAEAASLTFLVAVDYAEDAPGHLRLVTTITDATGKAVAEREDVMADPRHRYRLKKVTLDRLPAGDYAGMFRLSAENATTTQEVKFTVR